MPPTSGPRCSSPPASTAGRKPPGVRSRLGSRWRRRGRQPGRVQELAYPVERFAGRARSEPPKLAIDAEPGTEQDHAVPDQRVEAIERSRRRAARPEPAEVVYPA